MESQYIVIAIIIILFIFNVISIVNYIYTRDKNNKNDIFKRSVDNQEEHPNINDIDEKDGIDAEGADVKEADVKEADVKEADVKEVDEKEVDEKEVAVKEVDEKEAREKETREEEILGKQPQCIEDIIETYKDQLEIETTKFLNGIGEEDGVSTIYDEIYKVILSWMENRMVNILEDYIQQNKECVIKYDISTVSNAFHEYVRAQLLSVHKQFYLNYAYKYNVPATSNGFNALLRNCNKEIKYDIHQDMYEFIESYLSKIPDCSKLVSGVVGEQNIGCCPIDDKCINNTTVESAKRKCYCCLDTQTKQYNSYMAPCNKINQHIEDNLTKMMKHYDKSVCLNNTGCTIKDGRCVCEKIINSTSFVPCMKSNQYKNYKNGCMSN